MLLVLGQASVLFEEVVVSVTVRPGLVVPRLGEQTDQRRNAEVEDDAPAGAVQGERVAADADEVAQFGYVGEGYREQPGDEAVDEERHAHAHGARVTLGSGGLAKADWKNKTAVEAWAKSSVDRVGQAFADGFLRAGSVVRGGSRVSVILGFGAGFLVSLSAKSSTRIKKACAIAI